MKNTVRLIIAMLGVTMLLTACNDPQSVVESPSAQETSPSESGKKSSLPDAYQYRNGTLFLIWENSVDSKGSYDSLVFDSVEDMKEKFINLSFTEEERLFIEKSILHNDRMAVIDPRLLAPLKFPEGVSLKEAAFRSFYQKSNLGPTDYSFSTKRSADYKLSEGFSAKMTYRGGTANPYQREVLEMWIDKDGTYETQILSHLEETTYKGYPALRMENDPSSTEGKHIVWRYIADKNGRIYYVEDNIYYKNSNTTEISYRKLTVNTLYQECEYTYIFYTPTEECVDNFFKYDPFTYVEIVE